jgi:hypothetical protein
MAHVKDVKLKIVRKNGKFELSQEEEPKEEVDFSKLSCREKMSNQDHIYYWRKMLLLEVIEMILSGINLIKCFQMDIFQTTFYYIPIVISIAIALDLISIAEYIYLRRHVFASKSHATASDKHTMRLFALLFSTKEVISDTLHVYAGMEMQVFLHIYESRIGRPDSIPLAIIYGVPATAYFYYNVMEAFIEFLRVKPFNSGKRLLGWFFKLKVLLTLGLFVGLIWIQTLSPASTVPSFKPDKNLNHLNINQTTYRKKDSDRADNIKGYFEQAEKEFNAPCECVEKQCYSKSCDKTDKFRRLNCSLSNKNGKLLDCGKVFTAPEFEDIVTKYRMPTFGGFLPTELKYYEAGTKENYRKVQITREECRKMKAVTPWQNEGCDSLSIYQPPDAFQNSSQIGFNTFIRDMLVVCPDNESIDNCLSKQGGVWSGKNARLDDLWYDMYKYMVAHRSCYMCNDIWLKYAGDAQFTDGNQATRGNKCLCDETQLDIKNRVSRLKRILAKKELQYNNVTYHVVSRSGEKSQNILMASCKSMKSTAAGGFGGHKHCKIFPFTSEIMACSSNEFHGFKNQVACGMIMNSTMRESVALWSLLLTGTGIGIYICIWGLGSSLCLQQCIIRKTWCRCCFPYARCDRDGQPCCKRPLAKSEST